MAIEISTLSDKEKLALRLLLSGHDAKSSARELGLSVHTINDRLRNARRKLGVSSSREAARILGDAESATPELSVHTSLGIEEEHNHPDDEGIAEQGGRGGSRPAWRSKGFLIMSAFTVFAATALAVSNVNTADTSSVTPTASPVTEGRAEASDERQMSDAERDGREWLVLVDAGDNAGSRAAAGAPLRTSYGESMWELGIALLRANYGPVLSRSLLSVEITSSLEGGATGDFTVLVFETRFARVSDATEQLTLQRIGGAWRVIDYEVIAPQDVELG